MIESFREKYSGMTTAEVREKLKKDPAFKTEIETLYTTVFHQKLNRSCSNCWEDAFIVLMAKSLDEMLALSHRKFELKAGALLLDLPEGDNSKMATRHNLTDELAIYHLGKHPEYIKFFSVYPENWEEIVKEANSKDSEGSSDGEEGPTPSEAHEAAKKAVTYAKGYVTRSKNALDTANAMEDGEEKDEAVAKATETYEKAVAQLEEAQALLKTYETSAEQ